MTTTKRAAAAGRIDRRTLPFEFVVAGGVRGDDPDEYASFPTFDDAATEAIRLLRSEIDGTDWTHYPEREVTDRERAIEELGAAKGNHYARVEYGDPVVTPCYLTITRRRVEA